MTKAQKLKKLKKLKKFKKVQKLKKVKALVKKWSKRLYIEDWDIIINLEKDHESRSADIRPNPVYKFATMTVYDCAFLKPDKIEDVIKHELCHCLTEPLYEIPMDLINGRFRTKLEIEDQREILTEKIAKLL